MHDSVAREILPACGLYNYTTDNYNVITSNPWEITELNIGAFKFRPKLGRR